MLKLSDSALCSKIRMVVYAYVGAFFRTVLLMVENSVSGPVSGNAVIIPCWFSIGFY